MSKQSESAHIDEGQVACNHFSVSDATLSDTATHSSEQCQICSMESFV